VTVIEQGVVLTGCQNWAAGETIHLTFRSQDKGVYEGLELFAAGSVRGERLFGSPGLEG
jgi:hypothetical protein